MKIYAPSLICTALLAGCQTAPDRPPVEIPIPVPCQVQIPAKPDRCQPTDDSRAEYLRCLMLDHDRCHGYAAELAAALRACVE